MASVPAVEFRTGVADKLHYAVRWLMLAIDRGSRVRVLADPQDVPALSRILWTGDKEGFVPHVLCGPSDSNEADASAARSSWARTPILLGSGHLPEAEPELLLNLTLEMPAELAGYQRVIEVVANGDAEREAGRQRWAAYRRAGLVPAHRVSASASDGADAEEP